MDSGFSFSLPRRCTRAWTRIAALTWFVAAENLFPARVDHSSIFRKRHVGFPVFKTAANHGDLVPSLEDILAPTPALQDCGRAQFTSPSHGLPLRVHDFDNEHRMRIDQLQFQHCSRYLGQSFLVAPGIPVMCRNRCRYQNQTNYCHERVSQNAFHMFEPLPFRIWRPVYIQRRKSLNILSGDRCNRDNLEC